MNKNYYFILMSQKDFLENQVIEEVLREKANYYTSKNKLKDFWIVNSPSFIESEEIKTKIVNSNFYKQKNNSLNSNLNNCNYKFYSALITSDFEFIKWFQLRIGYFEDITDKSNIGRDYVSDGIFGKLDKNILNNFNLFKNSLKYIHPDILLDRYKKSIEIYYNS